MWRGISAAVAGIIGAVGIAGSATAADPIVGRATVIDGDTVEVAGQRIRVYGIDAPESDQTCKRPDGETYRCGQAAALALAERIGQASVACDPIELDRYGRTVAVCERAGEDLGAWMVAQGYAIAFRKYSAAYIGEETEARTAVRGVWAGPFTEPAEYRRKKRTGE